MSRKNKNSKKEIIVLYDKESDILSVGKNEKVKFSIDIGEIILDVSSRGSIIGADFLNFSKNFKMSKKEISEIHKAIFNVKYNPNYILVMIMLYRKQKEPLPIPISLNTDRATLLSA